MPVELLTIGVIVAIGIACSVASTRVENARQASLRAAAMHLTNVVFGDSRIEGERRGVCISLEELPSAPASDSRTVVMARVASVPSYLSIGKRPLFGRAENELPFDDPTFAGHFIVESAPEELARTILTPSLRAGLMRLVGLRSITLVIADGEIVLRRMSVSPPNSAWCLGAIECVAYMVTALRLASANTDRAIDILPSETNDPPQRTDVAAVAAKRSQAAAAEQVAAKRTQVAAREERQGRIALAVFATVMLAFAAILRLL